MNIIANTTDSKNIIVIYTDETLDLSSYFTFSEAAEMARKSALPASIFVDMDKTRQLFDSGRAMLQTLHQMAGGLITPIYLTNVDPVIKNQLALERMPTTMILT